MGRYQFLKNRQPTSWRAGPGEPVEPGRALTGATAGWIAGQGWNGGWSRRNSAVTPDPSAEAGRNAGKTRGWSAGAGRDAGGRMNAEVRKKAK